MQSLLVFPAAVAATLYAAGSFQIKACLTNGTARRRAIAVTNLAMVLWSLPLFMLSRDQFSWPSLLIAAAAGACLFAGRILAVIALREGELSLVGPLLGMKTLLVACFSFLSGQSELTPPLWTAAVLVTLGVALLQRGPKHQSRHRTIAAAYALGAGILFAGCDILVVEARAHLSTGWLAPTLFITVGALTPLMGKPASAPLDARKALRAGALIMGFQTTFVILLISLTGQAVLINIVYATRSLWTVLFDRWFTKGEAVRTFFAHRLAGAALVVAAIAVILFSE